MNEYKINMTIRLSCDYFQFVEADSEDEAWGLVKNMIQKDDIDPFNKHFMDTIEIDDCEMNDIKKL